MEKITPKIILVEGESDLFFLTAYLLFLSKEGLINAKFERIHLQKDYLVNKQGGKKEVTSRSIKEEIQITNMQGKDNLKSTLVSVIRQFEAHKLNISQPFSVGILIDDDSRDGNTAKNRTERLKEITKIINEVLKNYSTTLPVSVIQTKQPYLVSLKLDSNDQLFEISFLCEFIEKELEYLLHSIVDRTEKSTKQPQIADSFLEWAKNWSAKITEKDAFKEWYHYYKKYDLLTDKQRKEMGKYGNDDHIFEHHTGAFDWNHAILGEIKAFLKLFIC